MTDTQPTEKHAGVDGYEPPIIGESQREARARRARNRRRAERSQDDTATATSTSTATSTPTRPKSTRKVDKRATAVTGVLTGVGIGVMAFDQFDGETIIEGAPGLGDALAALAEKNPRVAKALDALTETSAWAEVAAATGAIVIPIARHHAQLRAERIAEAAAVEVDLDGDSSAVEVDPEPAPGANSGMQPAQADASAPTIVPGEQVSDSAPVFSIDDTPAPDPVPTFRA